MFMLTSTFIVHLLCIPPFFNCFYFSYSTRTVVVSHFESTFLAQDVPIVKRKEFERELSAISLVGRRIQTTRWIQRVGSLDSRL